MASIYDLSWSKTAFLAKLQLFFKSQKQEKEKIQSSDRQVQAQGCSALSSTYYSIVGTAASQLRATLRPKWRIPVRLVPVRIVAWCFTWLPLAAWCYWRMLSLSNRVVELTGYEGMSAEECDVRQSILRRRGRYDEAKKCILAALAKNPEKAHTYGLLHIGLAEVYVHEGDRRKVELHLHHAIILADKAAKEDRRQAARIYRQCADIVDFFRPDSPVPGDRFRHRARELAEATGARDQMLKL